MTNNSVPAKIGEPMIDARNGKKYVFILQFLEDEYY
jgi:hypothetical protein